jgi:hypothetical protein
MEETINNTLIWLFLNYVVAEDSKQLVALSYGSTNTPAVLLARRVSACLMEILMNIGSHAQNLEATKIALKSLSNIVRSLNRHVITRSETDRISFN